MSYVEMKKDSSMVIRLSDNLKKESVEILKEKGINSTSLVIRSLLKYIVEHKELPDGLVVEDDDVIKRVGTSKKLTQTFTD